MVLPYLKDILQEDVMVSITDKEKFLGYWPGDKMSVPLKAGLVIPADDPLRATINSKEIIKAVVPAEVYGMPFKLSHIPLLIKKGYVLGPLVLHKVLKKSL